MLGSNALSYYRKLKKYFVWATSYYFKQKNKETTGAKGAWAHFLLHLLMFVNN